MGSAIWFNPQPRPDRLGTLISHGESGRVKRPIPANSGSTKLSEEKENKCDD